MLTSLTKMSPEDILSTGADFTEMVLVTGSTHFSAANTRAVLANTNVKSLIQAYGATELGGIVAVDDTENTIAGSVGLVGPNTGLEVCVNKETTINHLLVVRNCKWRILNNFCCFKIVDIQTGELLGPNQTGEICFKGPSVGLGYLNNPEENSRAFRDGWFHTGLIFLSHFQVKVKRDFRLQNLANEIPWSSLLCCDPTETWEICVVSFWFLKFGRSNDQTSESEVNKIAWKWTQHSIPNVLKWSGDDKADIRLWFASCLHKGHQNFQHRFFYSITQSDNPCQVSFVTPPMEYQYRLVAWYGWYLQKTSYRRKVRFVWEGLTYSTRTLSITGSFVSLHQLVDFSCSWRGVLRSVRTYLRHQQAERLHSIRQHQGGPIQRHLFVDFC